MDAAASAQRRHEPPNIRGITKDDIDYTTTEVMEMLSRLQLHQEEKDMIVARATRKLGIWRKALEQ